MSQPVIPPITPAATVSPTGTNVAGQGDVQNNPTVNLPISVAIAGFVINRDMNNTIVRTAQGDVSVPTQNLFIKTGSEVVVQSGGQTGSMQIVSIDRMTPSDYVAQTTRAMTQDRITASNLPLDPAKPAAPLPQLQSVVLQAAVRPPITVPPVLNQLQAGTPLTLTVVDVQLPPVPIAVSSIPQTTNIAHLLPAAAAQTPTTNVAPPQLASNAVHAAIQAGNAAYAQSAFAGGVAPILTGAVAPSTGKPAVPNQSLPPTPLEAGEAPLTAAPVTPPNPNAPPAPPTLPNSGTATPANAQMPATALPTTPTLATPVTTAPTQPTVGAPVPAPTNPPAAPIAQNPQPPTNNAPAENMPKGQLFQATVIGHGEDGLNIVHTDFATLKLYSTQPLPTGTHLQVGAEIAPAIVPPSVLTAFSELGSKLPAPPLNFTYLTQSINQLVAQDPTAARELLAQLPVIGPKFTSGLLFFLGAVKTGDTKDILGNRSTQAVESLSPGLLAHFAKDIADLNQNFTNSPLTDWKAITLPLIFGNEANPARLYVRDESGGNAQSVEAVGGQRFVLDVNFSEIGQLQFDGFIRQSAESKAFELYIRSDQTLDTGFTQNIRQLFNDTIEASGLKGNLVFQAGTEHFTRPQLKPLGPISTDGARTILA